MRKKDSQGIDDTYLAADINGYELGEAREVQNKDKYFKLEYFKQYRSLSFIKRSIILLAGIAVNILFAMLVFVVLYSLIGFDLQDKAAGDINHIFMTPIESIVYGIKYV